MESRKVTYTVIEGTPDDDGEFNCVGDAIEHAEQIAEERGSEQYVYQLLCIVPPREKL